MAGTRAGVHRAPHRVARRPARPGPGDAATGRLARTHGDLRGRLRRDGFGRARAGGAAHDPPAADRAPRGDRPDRAGRERARVRAVPRQLRRGPRERLRDPRAHHAREGRLHDPGGRPVRGLLLGRSGRARRLRARPVDQPGRMGPRPVGDQPRVPAGARDGRPAPAVQARDAHARVERRHGGHVHGAAVRRHDRLVVPPAPLARRRRRPERVPRRGGRRRDLGDAPARDRRRAAARARAHAVLRADRELVPPDDERRVLGQRAVVGVRQPDGLVPRAHRIARVHPARMARARRRRGSRTSRSRRCSPRRATGSRTKPNPASR